MIEKELLLKKKIVKNINSNKTIFKRKRKMITIAVGICVKIETNYHEIYVLVFVGYN